MYCQLVISFLFLSSHQPEVVTPPDTRMSVLCSHNPAGVLSLMSPIFDDVFTQRKLEVRLTHIDSLMMRLYGIQKLLRHR